MEEVRARRAKAVEDQKEIAEEHRRRSQQLRFAKTKLAALEEEEEALKLAVEDPKRQERILRLRDGDDRRGSGGVANEGKEKEADSDRAGEAGGLDENDSAEAIEQLGILSDSDVEREEAAAAQAEEELRKLEEENLRELTLIQLEVRREITVTLSPLPSPPPEFCFFASFSSFVRLLTCLLYTCHKLIRVFRLRSSSERQQRSRSRYHCCWRNGDTSTKPHSSTCMIA